MIASIFTAVSIEAKEGRDVAIIDLSGAFLHAWNNENVIIFMKGKLAKIMVMIAPQINQNNIMTSRNSWVNSMHASTNDII